MHHATLIRTLMLGVTLVATPARADPVDSPPSVEPVAPVAAPEMPAAPAPARPVALPGSNAPDLTHEQGMVVLDYEVIPVPGLQSIDLLGFHFFTRVTDWLHLGVGSYAPLVRGDYGGFMTFDVSAHVQRRVHGRWVAAAGLSVGGGGGGKSAEQSKVLSGSGGYAKVYAGLGYEFDHFTLGASIARFRFTGSVIGHTQPNLFLQVPFPYTVGSYASAGRRYAADAAASADGGAAAPAETMILLGADNYKQLDPKGSNTGVINSVALQYSRFHAPDDYWFFEAGLGYRGLPMYNQVLGGIGHRVRLGPRVNLYGQVAVGSGGYAPDTIDTGPGLLVYPKVMAEYAYSRQLGLALTAGYLAAPRGTSRNATVGAALLYRLNPSSGGGGEPLSTVHRGVRFHLLHQTEFDVRVANRRPDDIRMLTLQIDLVGDGPYYVPLQGSVATNAYIGYPGYGEVLVGLGVQTPHERGERLQYFGQLLAGPNVHGLVIKPQLGMTVSLSDQLAISAQASRTIALDDYPQTNNRQRFRANGLALGLTYRFSVPSR